MTGLATVAAPAVATRTTFHRYKYFTPSTKALLDDFISLFHPYSYIFKYEGQSWQSAKDPRWKLSPSEISKAICGIHSKFVGTRWGTYTKHAVLDIDSKSRYHTVSSLKQLLETLTKAGLPNAVSYQSSDSGGWHIYIFFEQQISSRKLQHYLKQLLRLKGFVLQNGTLEVFPDPGSAAALGQGLRLPLQPGFAWIDSHDTEVRYFREELSPAQALGKFMSDLEENIHSLQEYGNFCSYVDHIAEVTTGATITPIPSTQNIRKIRNSPLTVSSATDNELTQVIQIFGTIPPNIDSARWLWGRALSQTGLTEESQRHLANKALQHYYFYGDPSRSIQALGYGYADEREAVVKQVLMTKHNGFSKEINRDSSEVLADISRAAHWLPLHKRNNPNVHLARTTAATNVRNKLANIKRSNLARQRIKQAVETLSAQAQPLRVNDLVRQAHCSKETLYKHQDLWKKSYAENRLASSTGVYSVGCGGIRDLNAASTPPDNKKEPLELLAARQIVSELKDRIKRAKEKRNKTKTLPYAKVEQRWHMQLATNLALLPSDYASAEPETIKLVLNLLSILKAIAPSYEDQITIEQHLESLQSALHKRLTGPHLLTHAPP
jgi:hypothetical protein